MLEVGALRDYPEAAAFLSLCVLAVQDRPPQGSLGCLSVLTSHAHGRHPASTHPGGHTALCAGGTRALCSVEAAELSPTPSSLWHTQSTAGPALKMG